MTTGGPVSVFLVAGARPNFVKIAPLYAALTARPQFRVTIVHTGQHYDEGLSDVFFRDLGLPRPDVMLAVGSGRHGVQTARVLERFEAALLEGEPDLVIVVGDVNSTVACALAAAKVSYPSGRRPRVAHVEAGLRSFDRSMPEEINRIVTDAICDFLFTTEESANVNLAREGVVAERVFFVGNVMIDALLEQNDRFARLRAWETFGVKEGEYALLTLHRPSTVDNPQRFTELMTTLCEVAARIPLIYPVHPRAADRIREFGLEAAVGDGRSFKLTAPMGYLEFLGLMSRARVVLTDSGGIQEETTILGVPCLTLRENTERPVTLSEGTNMLVGVDRKRILGALEDILAGRLRAVRAPRLWDGKAAERIVQVLEEGF